MIARGVFADGLGTAVAGLFGTTGLSTSPSSVALVASTGVTNRRVAARHFHGLADLWRALAKDLFDPYRPELHYMRGPGPKWRAKHPTA